MKYQKKNRHGTSSPTNWRLCDLIRLQRRQIIAPLRIKLAGQVKTKGFDVNRTWRSNASMIIHAIVVFLEGMRDKMRAEVTHKYGDVCHNLLHKPRGERGDIIFLIILVR